MGSGRGDVEAGYGSVNVRSSRRSALGGPFEQEIFPINESNSAWARRVAGRGVGRGTSGEGVDHGAWRSQSEGVWEDVPT